MENNTKTNPVGYVEGETPNDVIEAAIEYGAPQEFVEILGYLPDLEKGIEDLEREFDAGGTLEVFLRALKEKPEIFRNKKSEECWAAAEDYAKEHDLTGYLDRLKISIKGEPNYDS